jgi:hypothetical protein
MSSTKQGARSAISVARAWISVVLIPVFLFVSVVMTLFLYEWSGYKPENDDAPLWVELVTTIAAIAVFLVPCVTACSTAVRRTGLGIVRVFFPWGSGRLLACRSLS